MNENPDAGVPQGASPDPLAAPQGPAPDPASAPSLDDTQRVDVPRFAPTPDPRPDDRWAWAEPASQPASERWYEPGPAAGQPAYGGPAPYGAAGWGQPSTPPPAYAAAPAPVTPAPKRGAGAGTVVAAALLSAVLASAGTVAALSATGAFDQPAPVTTLGTAQPVTGSQPVTIDESSAVISAAERVGPAVVKISVAGTTEDQFGTIPSDGVGSGFLYDPNGWILTNRHVVSDADRLTVELKDGRQFDGEVYGIDTLTDLAIVKVNGTGLPYAPLGQSDGLKIGQLVVAIGSPLGTYSFSVTSGIVSGKGRTILVDNGTRINNLIQTDAAINPGNSGGPLSDASGAVVGINTAVATDSSGIGFAIPIDIARPIMEQAVRGEDLNRPWIGIRFEPITLQVQKQRNLPVSTGALVNNEGGTGPAVVEGSPAAEAGIQEGDIVLRINGKAVDQEHPLDALLTQFAPEESVTLEVLRDGATIQVDVTLGTRPSNL